MIESIGDKYIDEYTETDAQQFFDDLSGLPKGYADRRIFQCFYAVLFTLCRRQSGEVRKIAVYL